METKNNPVSWFEIPVHEMDRAKRFYEGVLEVDLQLVKMDRMTMAWFPAVEGGPGAAGTLLEGETYVPSHDGTMVYFSVEDIGATLERVARHGGKILRPKMSIGEYGFVGHFEDSEGNRVALHSTS